MKVGIVFCFVEVGVMVMDGVDVMMFLLIVSNDIWYECGNFWCMFLFFVKEVFSYVSYLY